jgi:hypothetical protein
LKLKDAEPLYYRYAYDHGFVERELRLQNLDPTSKIPLVMRGKRKPSPRKINRDDLQ